MDQHSPTHFFANSPDYGYSSFDTVLTFEEGFKEIFASQEHQDGILDLADLKPVTKTIKKNCFDKRHYTMISNEIRLQLIEAVHKHGEKIKFAAQRLGINYSSAKAIWQTYKREGRSHKKLPLKAREMLISPTPVCDSASTSDTTKLTATQTERMTMAPQASVSQVKNVVNEQPNFPQHQLLGQEIPSKAQPQSVHIAPVQPIYQLANTPFPTSILNLENNQIALINPASLNQNISTTCEQLSDPNLSYALNGNNQPLYSPFHGGLTHSNSQGFFTIVNQNQVCHVPAQNIRVMLVPISQLSTVGGLYKNYCN